MERCGRLSRLCHSLIMLEIIGPLLVPTPPACDEYKGVGCRLWHGQLLPTGINVHPDSHTCRALCIYYSTLILCITLAPLIITTFVRASPVPRPSGLAWSPAVPPEVPLYCCPRLPATPLSLHCPQSGSVAPLPGITRCTPTLHPCALKPRQLPQASCLPPPVQVPMTPLLSSSNASAVPETPHTPPRSCALPALLGLCAGGLPEIRR